ncbi:MAG: M1 family metallopeptidase [Bacteroidota bacterium]
MKNTFLLIGLLGIWLSGWSQESGFTRKDSLRGMLTPLRTCFDVTYYDLEIKLDSRLRRIAGINRIHFTAQTNFDKLQLDLFANMDIAEIRWRGDRIPFRREFDAVMVQFPSQIRENSKHMLEVMYSGSPVEAVKPPWDGGFIWKKDERQRDWIGVACEGLGASAWWPLKDHLSDEPDSMQISVVYPREYTVVSNGKLRSVEEQPGEFRKWTYFVGNPINSYNVSIYIGDYVEIQDTYQNKSGTHPLTYHVLRTNRSKAEKHFAQVKRMLACFEKHFGEYPFWEDGYRLIETSYWGMEHQSGIAYGNQYRNNAFGFDFIIVHESGHEWFGNSMSVADHADMWIHEAFTTYAEAIYVEHFHGYDRSIEYLNTQRPLIANKVPLVGPKGVNYDKWPEADIYYKGSWMLHTLRKAIDDDERWFDLIHDFSTDHRSQAMDTEKVVEYFNWKMGENYDWFFNQYLHHTRLPVLEYGFEKKGKKAAMRYRWVAEDPDFQLPVTMYIQGEEEKIYPTTEWKRFYEKGLNDRSVTFDANEGLFEWQKVQ